MQSLRTSRTKCGQRQDNYVFPATVRNLGGFYRGLYEQSLTGKQWAGFVFLLLFYVVLITGLVYQRWPSGNGSVWQKIANGYWAYFLLALPVAMFFWLINRMARKELKRINALERKLPKQRRL